MPTRKVLVEEARKWHAVRPSGGSPLTAFDCGGTVLVAGRALGLTKLEFLGYANFPSGGKFDELLRTHAVETDSVCRFPFKFDGTELKPADLLSFDYGSGEGVRHVAFVTKWNGRSYWVSSRRTTNTAFASIRCASLS